MAGTEELDVTFSLGYRVTPSTFFVFTELLPYPLTSPSLECFKKIVYTRTKQLPPHTGLYDNFKYLKKFPKKDYKITKNKIFKSDIFLAKEGI